MKHSPRIHEKIQEADNANYCWFKNALIALGLSILAALAFTSCTKEVSQPIQLRPPVRPKPVTVTMKFFKTSHAYVIGDTYGVQLNTSQVMKVDTHFYLEWKSGTEKYTLKPIIYANSSS